MVEQLKNILVLLLLLRLLNGCASVPNVPICVEIHQAKGFCTETIEDRDFYIDETHPHSFTGKKEDALTWWEMRHRMILIPAQSWAELKAYIIKQCKRTNCDQYIKSWDRKINELEEGASK